MGGELTFGYPGYNLGTVNFSNNIMTQSASPTAGMGIELNAEFLVQLSLTTSFLNGRIPIIHQ